MPRILIVEDEPDIALGLQRDLLLEGYAVDVAHDGDSAVVQARRGAIDLILLDVMLPGKNGFDVCRELRRSGLQTPIVVLTARGGEAEKVQGLELGADDYVTKPFSPNELRARIRSILRHRDEWRGEGAKLDHELQTAAEVQQRLLPQRQPAVRRFDYVGFCQPARRVGGDYYDYLDLPGGQLGLIVADVAGKGASAALVEANEEFSSDRVGRLLVESPVRTAAEMRDAVLVALRAHTGGCPQSDDVTFIAGVVS